VRVVRCQYDGYLLVNLSVVLHVLVDHHVGCVELDVESVHDCETQNCFVAQCDLEGAC